MVRRAGGRPRPRAADPGLGAAGKRLPAHMPRLLLRVGSALPSRPLSATGDARERCRVVPTVRGVFHEILFHTDQSLV